MFSLRSLLLTGFLASASFLNLHAQTYQWIPINTNSSHNLKDGIAMGNSLILVGDSGKYVFKKYSYIDKAGLFPDYTGIIWFNFFWIRGSFLKQLNPPIITNDRYYYEHHYIKSSQNNNCFNLTRFDLSRSGMAVAAKRCLNNKAIINNFNWKKYVSKYPDLKGNINSKNAYQHFINYGIYESRDLI